MQTFEDIRQAALGRLAEFSAQYPVGKQVPYRRIGVRQQQLYAMAAHENPEYAGQCAIGTVDDGDVALSSIADPVAVPERITKIVVHSISAGCAYAVGDEVTIVTVADQDGVKPRALLRNNTLYGVAGELANVVDVEIFYPYRPDPAESDEDGTRDIEIADPHSELLVVDLTRSYVRKMLQLDARNDIVALLNEEETPMIELWLQHVREYAPVSSRFSLPPAAPVPRVRRANA